MRHATLIASESYTAHLSLISWIMLHAAAVTLRNRPFTFDAFLPFLRTNPRDFQVLLVTCDQNASSALDQKSPDRSAAEQSSESSTCHCRKYGRLNFDSSETISREAHGGCSSLSGMEVPSSEKSTKHIRNSPLGQHLRRTTPHTVRAVRHNFHDSPTTDIGCPPPNNASASHDYFHRCREARKHLAVLSSSQQLTLIGVVS